MAQTSTALRGYAWQLSVDILDPYDEMSEEQIEAAQEWLVAEVNNLLPDYAQWSPDTSEIILPIDKLRDFSIAMCEAGGWDCVRNTAWTHFLQREA